MANRRRSSITMDNSLRMAMGISSRGMVRMLGMGMVSDELQMGMWNESSFLEIEVCDACFEDEEDACAGDGEEVKQKQMCLPV